MLKRKLKKEYVPSEGSLLPYAENREAILAEIDAKNGIYVNNKWNIQLKDRTCQKSRDIRRMIKLGLIKLVGISPSNPLLGRKRSGKGYSKVARKS